MNFDSDSKHYNLTNTDIVNNLGYDLAERAASVRGTNANKRTNRFLKALSETVYGVIEQRLEKDYLVEQFNADTAFVLDTLLLQFEFWENSDLDIFQTPVNGIAPLVSQKLRNKGLLFEGVIVR